MQAVLNNEGIFVWYLEEENAPAILLITKKEKINKNIGREEGEEITYVSVNFNGVVRRKNIIY